MTFTTINYFIFFPLVYLVFWFTSDRWRWLLLLVASYGFYATFEAPYLLAVLFMVTLISYACGLRIGSHQDEAGRKRWLQIGIVMCIAILAILKYLPSLGTQTTTLFGVNSLLSNTIISIGVSYFTFQAISYLADIYLEIEEPEMHFGRFALYMAFFPKLLQGPIERAGDLLPQLTEKFEFDYDRTKSGMILFVWGLLKKLVIANSMSQLVDPAYNNVGQYSGAPLLFATYCYYIQIYFDFSGYTDMARGSARMFNLNLSQNFDKPYLATSIADFWRRWHISFSRWILDYIFRPLQMYWRESKTVGTAGALFVTFFVSGIWHGASWCFVSWGLLYGIYMASSVFYKPYQKKIYNLIGVKKGKVLDFWQRFITFHMVTFAWIFFRANNVNDALNIVKKIVVIPIGKINFTEVTKVIEIFGKKDLAFVLVILTVILIIETNMDRILALKANMALRWCSYVCLLMTILFFARFHNSSEFIYLSF